MKQFIITKTGVALMGLLILYSTSCSLNSPVEDPNFIPASVGEGAPEAPSIQNVYKALKFYSDIFGHFAASEYSTDLIAVPARGANWFDGGKWLQNNLHTWTTTNEIPSTAWGAISSVIYQSTLVAETTKGQTQAEGKFIRAFASYLCCDLFGQVQHRPAAAAVSAIPDVFTRSQAVDFVISELKDAIANLPSYSVTNRGSATKEAAKCLLAKAYLNKAVYKQNPEHPEGPYSFNPADMNEVIRLCDEVLSNGLIGFSDNYWDNFKWDNSTKSKENFFVLAAANGENPIGFISVCSLHGNMPPGGWNGPSAFPKFYDSFENDDIRKKYNIPGNSEYLGYNAGFILGQQYGPPSGKSAGPNALPLVPLKDGTGNLLILSRDFSLYASTDIRGIRYNKFPMSITNNGYQVENDFPIFRYADVRLMKAEAILRGGTSSETPLSIINGIRQNRKAPDLKTADLPTVLAERGRELYCEGWRRSDQVRFGTYTLPRFPEKMEASPGYSVLLPIPFSAVASNPNLKQNFGY